MAIATDCAGTGCTVQVSPGRRYVDPEPPEFCEGDPVAHSDLCAEHGGEADREDYLQGWLDWVGDDGPCACVEQAAGLRCAA